MFRKRRENKLIKEIKKKEDRRIKSKKEKEHFFWFGMGMMGMVGWSIILPTLLGLAMGYWMDAKFPSRFSWTLTLLFLGLLLGCLHVLFWLNKEKNSIGKKS